MALCLAKGAQNSGFGVNRFMLAKVPYKCVLAKIALFLQRLLKTVVFDKIAFRSKRCVFTKMTWFWEKGA